MTRKEPPPTWLGICETTGKRSYVSRRVARQAEKQQRGVTGRMCAYECRCGFWHLGHLPKAVILGRSGREELT